MLIRFPSFRYIVAAHMAALAALPCWLSAQGSYSSLEVPYHVRSVSMGGIGIADHGGTDMAAFNPALLQGNTKELLLSVLRYPAQIQSEMVEFRFPWRERSVAVTVRHMGYGSFEALDEDGGRHQLGGHAEVAHEIIVRNHVNQHELHRVRGNAAHVDQPLDEPDRTELA